jgi:thiol-disulfide isomerase/thioredoxin
MVAKDTSYGSETYNPYLDIERRINVQSACSVTRKLDPNNLKSIIHTLFIQWSIRVFSMETSDRLILKCFISLTMLILVTGTATADDTQILMGKINTSLNNNIPVFVYFYSENCHFCQEQSPIVNKLEENYSNNIAFIYVNLDDNPLAGLEFNVMAVPITLLITDKDETQQFVYQEFRGLTNSTVLNSSIKQAIANIIIPPETILQTQDKTSGTVTLTLIIILIGITAVLLYVIRH